MPIEFRCTSCSKLLRTPDEIAGKKAKCPQCETIVDVPDSSTAAGQGDEVPTGDVPRDSFARSDMETEFAQQDPANPYSSPTTMAPLDTPDVPKGKLQHGTLEFDAMLRTAWEFFRENIGPLALFGLVVFGINVGLQIIAQVGNFAVQARGEVAMVVVFGIVNGIFGFLVQTFVQLGTVIYMLKMVRTRQAQVSDLFSASPFFVKGILMTLLVMLIYGGLTTVFVIPVAITIPLQETAVTVVAGIVSALVFIPVLVMLVLRFMLGLFFVVDRGAGVIESLSLSGEYMKGNKLTAFLIGLVVIILGGVFGLGTCFFGYILYIPFWGLLWAMVYLTCTGQPFQQPIGNKPVA